MVSPRTLQRRRRRFGPVRICPRRLAAWSTLVITCAVIAVVVVKGLVALAGLLAEVL